MSDIRPDQDVKAKGRVPISAYLMAVISGLFVTFGVMIVVAFSHLFIGDWATTAPKLLLMAVPFIAIVLGLLTAWQTVAQAKRKAVAEAQSKKS